MVNVFMLSVVMLSVVMLSVIIQNDVVPFFVVKVKCYSFDIIFLYFEIIFFSVSTHLNLDEKILD
jgi:hypothetical protein